ncbi:hypothetical protein [Anaerobacillus sp. CMMVII]|uniref:hypothetical protein n=1 Tax=Anaerobacillus sp. CMMVII TaxID=2755588 RepID=UPI0037C10455
MKRLVTICLVSLVLIGMVGCLQKPSDEVHTKVPTDFNFSLEYGTYGKQKIDTFNQIIVKDLVIDGTVEANIAFTVEEMKAIYERMVSINIMGNLDLEKEKECGVTPESYSSWTIEMNGESKKIFYKDYCEYPRDVLNLLRLEDYIHNLLTEKAEYKELPASNGYYE